MSRPLRIMVTGTRMMGVCRCPDGVTSCGVERVAWSQMDSALWRLRNEAISHGDSIELLHGAAEGADSLAAEYWETYRLGPVRAFPANWEALGRRAGGVRNGLMVAMMPDLVMGFPWVKRSRGTYDALRQARQAGLTVRTFPVVQVCPRYEATVDF